MTIELSELQKQMHSLRRAPPPKAPKAPSNTASLPRMNRPFQSQDNSPPITQLLPGVKLKRTGLRNSLIAEDVDNKHTRLNSSTDEQENELLSAIAKRKAKVEQAEAADDEIKPKPKPKVKPKPHLNDKPNDSVKENKETCTDVNKNEFSRDSKGEPKLCILPTLESLGKPPAKPAKTETLVKLLENYSRADIVIARRRSTLNRNTVLIENNTDVIAEGDEEQEDYDDVDEDLKAQILARANSEEEKQPTAEEDNGILEENYDDVDEVAEKVKEMNGKLDEEENTEGIFEESYDDLDTVAEQAQIHMKNDFSAEGGQQFGDDVYEALGDNPEEEDSGSSDNGFDSPAENKFSVSATPPSQQVKKNLKKEMELQKKKEKEELKKRREEEKRREKEEREEKKRKEEENKKREQKDKELRKKHKLKPGNEGGSGIGEAKSNFSGDGKFELPVKEGDQLVIVCENGCPSGKWLVKNTEGHLGYIPTEFFQLKIDGDGNRVSAIITEDMYEDVDKYQSAGQIGEEADDQEVYDDIGGEDIYEELPDDQ